MRSRPAADVAGFRAVFAWREYLVGPSQSWQPTSGRRQLCFLLRAGRRGGTLRPRDTLMLKELKAASREICRRLREKPYQKGVTITAWQAVVEQVFDGRRYGAFSWHNAIEIEVRRYIRELDESTKRAIWESTEDVEIIPNASIETITDCLYPFIFGATMSRVYRAVRRLEQKLGEPED